MEHLGDLPSTGDPERPLLLLLHGYGSNERDLPGIVDALPDRFDWVSLRGPLDVRADGYSWAPPIILPDSPPQPEPIRAGAAAILDWIDAEAAGRRIVPVGFSQGGLMVTQLLRARPRAFDAGVVLSGFHSPFGEPGDAELAEVRPPVFFGWGTADGIIPESAFVGTTAWLQSVADLTERVYPGLAHAISVEELGDIAAFLEAAVAIR